MAAGDAAMSVVIPGLGSVVHAHYGTITRCWIVLAHHWDQHPEPGSRPCVYVDAAPTCLWCVACPENGGMGLAHPRALAP